MVSSNKKEEDRQTIPARHGTATFVPKGSTIKIINSSGTQVIDTWAFVLASPPPKKKDVPQGEEQQKAKDAEEELEKESKKLLKEEDVKREADEDARKKSKEEEEKKKKAKNTSSSSSKKKSKGGLDLPSQEEAEKATAAQVHEEATANGQQQTPTKAGWSSYLPSLRGRKQQQQQQITDGKRDAKDEQQEESEDKKKKKDKENSKTWGSYLQYGQGVTSYLPSKGAISAFATQHARDPSKGIAEQLADFSRTPVGAASLSVLTGSGTAGSLYAGYSAWNSINGEHAQSEFLSMSHTRAATCHMIPRVNDVLVSNLRQPMLTVLEDTTGVHDTLIPACDPLRYKGFGVENWEEHGSCAENLVLALKELNERAGLKGPKGVGASVTVNSVPAPLNLFMNIPWNGDKGDITFEKPICKEGDYVIFKAERDVVVVMSACPNDVQDHNGKKIKDGHFIVEHTEDSEDEADEEKKVEEKKPEAKKKKPRKLNSGKKDDAPAKQESAAAKKDTEQPKKDDKAEEHKKAAEKVPLPSTPGSENPEPNAAPAAQKPKGKPEEQTKAEKTPSPSTPAVEKPDPTAAASKPKAKPKKLVDSSTGEKKKPRKLQPRGSTVDTTSGSQTPKEGDVEVVGDKNGKSGS